MEFHKVLPADESIVMFAKITLNQGRSPGIEKHDFYDAIVKRADELRADGESPQQAFSKVITEDETGRLLYKAMQIAPGAELKPVAQPAPPSREASARLLGPAHARLHSQAVDHQRANPRLSYEAAYSRMYTHPENASLARGDKSRAPCGEYGGGASVNLFRRGGRQARVSLPRADKRASHSPLFQGDGWRLYWSRVFVGGEGSSWTSCLCRKLQRAPGQSGGSVTPSGPPRHRLAGSLRVIRSN